MKEKYYYITGKRISKKQWDDFVKRYDLIGDNIIQGRTTIAYRRIPVMTECELVKLEGRA